MMFSRHSLLPVILATTVTTTTSVMVALPVLADAEDTVLKSTNRFEEMVAEESTRIPAELLRQSAGIAIIPDLTQGGFIVGARHGRGVLSVRNPDGTWSNPVFLTIGGGSIGLQAGGQSSDVVMVFPTRQMVDRVLNSEVEFGGNVSGVAGPVGAQPVDPIGDSFSGNTIYTYSRQEGLFGGVALEGGELHVDDSRTEDYYGLELTPTQVFNPAQPAPSSSLELKEVLWRASQ
ncbi:MAG: lipid-binding SYLF domain-containing protein [Synechococcus sp.]